MIHRGWTTKCSLYIILAYMWHWNAPHLPRNMATPIYTRGFFWNSGYFKNMTVILLYTERFWNSMSLILHFFEPGLNSFSLSRIAFGTRKPPNLKKIFVFYEFLHGVYGESACLQYYTIMYLAWIMNVFCPLHLRHVSCRRKINISY